MGCVLTTWRTLGEHLAKGLQSNGLQAFLHLEAPLKTIKINSITCPQNGRNIAI